MTDTQPPPLPLPPAQPAGPTFNYEAQTADGHRLSGSIEAADGQQAIDRLRGMQLRVVEVSPAPVSSRGKAIHGDEFAAFNQQLAQLAAAGFPIEQGLRLIAADMRSGKLARTIQRLATELEKGTPLDQAFDRMGKLFPPMYGRLISAGVKSGNLAAVLLNLGRHLETVSRLKTVLWRSASYPLFVLIAFGFLLTFLGIVVIPEFGRVYASYGIKLPLATEILLDFSRAAPALLVLLLIIVIGGPIAWAILARTGHADAIAERLVTPLPLIGPVLRFNLVARWCDAARLGVEAGMDLPSAIELANDAARSRSLARDGKALIEALSAGQALTAAETHFLPRSIPAAIQFASGFNDLRTTLISLSDMYQRQAELRISALPGILTPIFVIALALILGFVILGLVAPLVLIIEQIAKPY